MSTRTWCAIFIYPIALLLPASAVAQSAICAEKYLAKVKEEGPSLGLTATEAQNTVTRVAQSIGLQRSPLVIPCDFFNGKVAAWQAQGNSKVPDGEYIIYNPDWVRETIGNDKVQTVALFGHELGHFLNAHFTTNKNLPRQQQESEADEFAGCAVARMPADFKKLEDLLERIRLENDLVYPDRLHSIDVANAGYKNCGGSYSTKFAKIVDGGTDVCTSFYGTEIKKFEPIVADEGKYFENPEVHVLSGEAPKTYSCNIQDKITKKIKIYSGNTQKEIDVLTGFTVFAHADCGSAAISLSKRIAIKCIVSADNLSDK
jgi:hypothetical protein